MNKYVSLKKKIGGMNYDSEEEDLYGPQPLSTHPSNSAPITYSELLKQLEYYKQKDIFRELAQECIDNLSHNQCYHQ